MGFQAGRRWVEETTQAVGRKAGGGVGNGMCGYGVAAGSTSRSNAWNSINAGKVSASRYVNQPRRAFNAGWGGRYGAGGRWGSPGQKVGQVKVVPNHNAHQGKP